MTRGKTRYRLSDTQAEVNDLLQILKKNHQPDISRSFRLTINDDGQPVSPEDALVDVFGAFSESHNGVEVVTNEDLRAIQVLKSHFKHPLLRRRNSPDGSPQKEADVDLPERGWTSDEIWMRMRGSRGRQAGIRDEKPPSVPPRN